MDTAACERCGASTAKAYYFHYGRLRETTDFQSTEFSEGGTYGTRTSWTEHYRIGGLDSAWVCSRCMLRLRLKRSATILVHDYFGFPLIAFVYALGLLSVGYLGYLAITGADTAGNGSMWFLVALGVIPVVVYVLVFVFNPVVGIGEAAAIELHRKQLEAQGWHTFWSSKEYAKLGPERPSFPG